VEQNYSLQHAFDYFRAQSNLSDATLEMYAHALEHFFQFLESSDMAAPLSFAGPKPAEKSLHLLGSERQDVNILSWFVNYLGKEAESSKPRRNKRGDSVRFEPASVRLYGQAMVTFFSFLADELLLPERFPAPAALTRALRTLRTYVPKTEARDGAPEPPRGIEELIHAFDSPSIPQSLPLKEAHRRKLEVLRNRAILYALADSGARVSEMLRISADDVRGARLNRQGIYQIRVRGKGRGRAGREVTLRFTRPTLEAMREYLNARKDPGATALFVSHARTRPKYRGKPMSANAVWRMIQRTSKGLSLPHIRPHDFRHWRATQMLREGVPIDQVQRFLNHRSIRTTQLYAKTSEQQVDEAGAKTSPID
jgi:site-specific recombinase XerD